MASITKSGRKWRAQVKLKGVRDSDTFDTKAEAMAWAVETEKAIQAGKRGEIPDKTFGQLLERYRDEISITKKGERWERLRIGMLCRDEIAKIKLQELKTEHFATWRDRRLRSVSAASVLREWTLISHALNIAVAEWRWLRENPIKGVRRPAEPPPRDRRPSGYENERLLFALGYDYEKTPSTVTARVGAAWLFAQETALRAGEIAGLTRDRVDLEKRYVRLVETKNGTRRDVPLSAEAVRILRQVDEVRDGPSVFGLTVQQIDALFRKGKARAMIEDLHFHDSRHEAITRLAKKLDVLELARMVGHRDLRQLMVYYNATAEELAQKLD